MSYLVLARKYRPLDFTSVYGQEHVTRTLCNAIEREQIAHAFLFAGPRGVGKTSIARIFAKALNCDSGPTGEPCLKCDNCRDVANGTSLGVREIDGASHNSVDNVRDLIESFRSLPPPGVRYKIYIIDEVHMLSTSAFNALLKSLEEPPPNTVFILATTEAHKIPDTVISRCQRHDFRALTLKVIEESLTSVCGQEQIEIEPEAVRMIARLSDGSMRDAQSLLERVRSFCEQGVTAAAVGQVLGTVERKVLFDLSSAILERDPSRALSLLEKVFATGLDPSVFLKDFVTHWREMLIAAFDSSDAENHALLEQMGIPEEEGAELGAMVKDLNHFDIQDLVALAREGADSALRSSYPKYALESLVVRMATREPVKDLGVILGKMRQALSSKSEPAGAPPIKRQVNAPAPARSKPSPVAVDSPITKEKAVAGDAASRTTISKPKSAPERRVEKRSEPAPASAPTLQQESNAALDTSQSEPLVRRTELSWVDFVERTGASGLPMLHEHLKRLSVETFSVGSLIAVGTPFSVGYLQKDSNKSKLTDMLAHYSGEKNWKIDLQPGEVADETLPGSLLHREKAEKKSKQKKTAEELKAHPVVQDLHKAFPGSTVESIKLKN